MKVINLNARGKYGKSADKSLEFEELEFLRYGLEDKKERLILIATAYAGLRIGELVQCRKEWLRWDVLVSGEDKLRVLAIDIPEKTRNILNLYSNWNPKTKSKRTTYIIDENLAELFYGFYMDNPKGISELFKSKNHKSICRNISTYIIGTKFLKYLIEFHRSNGKEEDEIKEIRSKLSSHPLRSTYENLLFYKYKISIDISASILGHSEEVAKKHYISKSRGNIKNRLAQQIMRK